MPLEEPERGRKKIKTEKPKLTLSPHKEGNRAKRVFVWR